MRFRVFLFFLLASTCFADVALSPSAFSVSAVDANGVSRSVSVSSVRYYWTGSAYRLLFSYSNNGGTLSPVNVHVQYTGSGPAVSYDHQAAGGNPSRLLGPGPCTITMTLILGTNTRTESWSMDASGNVVDQPQSVTLTPSTATVLSGQYVIFTASGGQNDYQWMVTGGGVTKSGNEFLVRGGSTGSFSLTVWSPAGGGYARSNDATSVFTVQESFNKNITLPKNEGTRPVQYIVMQDGEVVAEYVQQPGQGARIVNVVVDNNSPLTVASRVIGIVQDENGVWIVDPNNNSPDTVSDPITPDSSDDEPGDTVTLVGPNAPNPGLPNNDNAPVWNTPTPNGDASGQVDLLTNSVFREGINHVAEDLGAIREFNETNAALEEEKKQALAEYINNADDEVSEKFGSWTDAVKAGVEAEFEQKWSQSVGETPAFASHHVSTSGGGSGWPQFTLPGLGTVVLSPYRLPWMITVLNVVREIILWFLVYGFIRYGMEKATDYSLQVATVPNATTTQDLLADAVPVVAEKVQYAKQGVTALVLVVTLVVTFGVAVGLISTGMWSILSGTGPSIFSFISSAGSKFSTILSGASSPMWGFIAEFFPLGAFITLLVAEVLLIAFMAPVFLLASVFVRTLRA